MPLYLAFHRQIQEREGVIFLPPKPSDLHQFFLNHIFRFSALLSPLPSSEYPHYPLVSAKPTRHRQASTLTFVHHAHGDGLRDLAGADEAHALGAESDGVGDPVLVLHGSKRPGDAPDI